MLYFVLWTLMQGINSITVASLTTKDFSPMDLERHLAPLSQYYMSRSKNLELQPSRVQSFLVPVPVFGCSRARWRPNFRWGHFDARSVSSRIYYFSLFLALLQFFMALGTHCIAKGANSGENATMYLQLIGTPFCRCHTPEIGNPCSSYRSVVVCFLSCSVILNFLSKPFIAHSPLVWDSTRKLVRSWDFGCILRDRG